MLEAAQYNYFEQLQNEAPESKKDLTLDEIGKLFVAIDH
jgi:hypothetical protein